MVINCGNHSGIETSCGLSSAMELLTSGEDLDLQGMKFPNPIPEMGEVFGVHLPLLISV